MITTVFELLVLYQLKHFLADYPLQGRYMLGKFLPGWAFVRPLLAHVAVHAVMTFAIALAFGKSVPFALACAGFDASVHFLMDRIKASPRWMGRWKPLTAPDWLAATKTVDDSYISQAMAPGYITETLPPDLYLAEWVNEKYKRGAVFLIRGLRGPADLEAEIAIEMANRTIAPDLQTVFFTASEDMRTVSSSAVKALVGKKGYERVLLDYVTPEVRDAIVETLATSSWRPGL